jgi:hypothetical protein
VHVVYVGDASQSYDVFDFTLDRGCDGSKRFQKGHNQVLLADAYGGYNGVVAGEPDHARWMLRSQSERTHLSQDRCVTMILNGHARNPELSASGLSH